jgi:hypothetical protein
MPKGLSTIIGFIRQITKLKKFGKLLRNPKNPNT